MTRPQQIRLHSRRCKTYNSHGMFLTVGGEGGGWGLRFGHTRPSSVTMSCSDICHVSNKPAVLCFPWKSPQTPQCHWSLAGRGRQASPRRPGFHNRGRESCWQGSPGERGWGGQESKEVDYGGGGATGALLAVPPECWQKPHRRLLCWEWGRKILGRWGAVDLKWWRKSTGFFQNRSMKADFEGFLQGTTEHLAFLI